MTRKIFKIALVLACLVGFQSARAEFKDIKIDLTQQGVLQADELQRGTAVKFGVVVTADGTNTRVDASDPGANIVIDGKYWNDHGLGGGAIVTLPVEGPVKIGIGTCQFGSGDVIVTNKAGEEVVKLNSNDGSCWKPDNNKYVYETYKGEADVLTIKVSNYFPAITVEAVNPADLVEDATVTYNLGEYAGAGTAPAAEKVEIGKTLTIPANTTIYQEGKTLVGWTDGSKNYEIGEIVTVETDMTLTPVFVDNTVSLADRTEPLTLKWDFGKRNGAPTIGVEGASKPSAILVTQATIGTETIDVKIDINALNGKFNNANRGDEWAQVNTGTILTVPSCKGAVISYGSYNNALNATIDGEPVNGASPSFTSASDTTPIDFQVTEGSYMSFIQVMLPLVQSAGGQVYENVDASVVWAFNSPDFATDITVTPENGFSVKNFDMGECHLHPTSNYVSTTECPDIKFVNIQSTNGPSDIVTWSVKPIKGLTFTPVSISFYISRNGTDGNGNDVTVKGAVTGGETIVFNSITPHRNNTTQAADKKGSLDSYTKKYEYTLTPEQQQALTSGDVFELILNNGYGNNKGCMYSDVHINGILNGTAEAVELFTFAAKPNIENAGTISVYPRAAEYEAGTEVKLTAERNFGFQFVNWTDAAGKEISTEAVCKYTVSANSELTANFKAINTYELAYAVEGGAKDYQVQLTPAPTVVDGKNMYEEGTTVTLNAIGNPVMTFTNWADGQSSSEISVVMDGDHTDIAAIFEAADFIAGWDFMKAGNNDRIADFAAADNDAVLLVLRDAEGNNVGWLDKSQFGAGGYEGRPAGVNWTKEGLGKYYWQTTVNAEAFTDLKVITAMAFNYNAYTTYNVEYSLDGETWNKVGNVTIPGAKNWVDKTIALPAEANNQKAVSIRWIADKSSEISGTQSDNDGISLGASYIVGTAKLINDGTAPVLVSQVPEEGSATASINGKIVLTFDEKVKVKEGVTATLGELSLTPSVTGKTVMFEYKNLAYATDYEFALPAGSIMDLTDNAMTEAIAINFTTKTRPVVAKGAYDAVVSTVDELIAAIDAAGNRADKTKRFRIFLHDGTYKFPASTTATVPGDASKGDTSTYPSPITIISTPNISFVGESRDGVVITNTVPTAKEGANPVEGIGKSDVLQLSKAATGTYFQHLTIKSAIGDAKGRDIELNDQSDKTICKDVCLWGYQDTYVSNNENSRFYFEGGLLRGRTDFLCGKGDVYYNAVTLEMCEKGGYLAVPSKPKKYGYIFKDCEINGSKSDIDGNYTLGRPWGSGTPIALFIDTKMNVKPSAIGWNEMSGGWPARFAEYNSTTASGTVIDLKDRKKSFGDANKNGIYPNNPILTREEAEFHTYARVMGGDDDWDPASLAEQAPAPANVQLDGSILSWDNNEYVFCWAVCKDGKVVAFTTEPTFTVEAEVAAKSAPVYSVRAANEMGGLGEAVEASDMSSISDINADSEVVSTIYYNLQGIRVAANTPGVLIKVDTLASGETVTTKITVK